MAVIFWKFQKPNNSDCMQDSCIIPTALPIFSWSKNSMKLLSILVWCKRKSEIQDYGSQRGNTNISAYVYNIAAKFQRQNSCFQGWGIQWRYYPYKFQLASQNKENNFTELPCIEYMCLAVRIVQNMLYTYRLRNKHFFFCKPPSWISDFCSHHTLWRIASLNFWTMKT